MPPPSDQAWLSLSSVRRLTPAILPWAAAGEEFRNIILSRKIKDNEARRRNAYSRIFLWVWREGNTEWNSDTMLVFGGK